MDEVVIMIDNYETCVKNKINRNIDANNKKYVVIRKGNLDFIDKCTSLEAIALQYDSSTSDDENNSELIKEVSNNKDYRIENEVILSSDESSDSKSYSSSESESNSEISSYSCNISNKNSDGSEYENQIKTKESNPEKIIKLKGEFDNLPPIQDLKISVPEVLCDPVGEIAWTVEQMVVVRPKLDKPTLNLDTVLFIEKGQRALGHIFDVFGQVTEPYYCIRFNSADHILESNIKKNDYFITKKLDVENKNNYRMKAVDEIGDDEPPQFSDDEEEQVYLASIKNKYNDKVKEISNGMPNKRKRDWQFNHPWNNNKTCHVNTHLKNLKPFYRSQLSLSMLRCQRQNIWHQYNAFPNNKWMYQTSLYNGIQSYNECLSPVNIQEMGIKNRRFPEIQWNPHSQLSQVNVVPLQGFPQTLGPSFSLPPPPPPPNTNK